LSIVLCFWLNRRLRVASILGDMFLDFRISFVVLMLWPVFCFWDLLGIPGRRREMYALRKAKLARRGEERSIKNEQRAVRLAIIGETGLTVSPLCLSGKVKIAGTLWDAVSLDGYIPQNEKVVVRKWVGNELKVELAGGD